MANETQLTAVGNLTADPELRYTQQGVPVANFTVASTPRVFDREKNAFVDGTALFLRCTVWREYAENVAKSLTKGASVIVRGNLKQTSYTDKDGNQRTGFELDVDEVGPTLRFATAQVQKVYRDQQGGQPQGQPQQAPQAQPTQAPQAQAPQQAPQAQVPQQAPQGQGDVFF